MPAATTPAGMGNIAPTSPLQTQQTGGQLTTQPAVPSMPPPISANPMRPMTQIGGHYGPKSPADYTAQDLTAPMFQMLFRSRPDLAQSLLGGGGGGGGGAPAPPPPSGQIQPPMMGIGSRMSRMGPADYTADTFQQYAPYFNALLRGRGGLQGIGM